MFRKHQNTIATTAVAAARSTITTSRVIDHDILSLAKIAMTTAEKVEPTTWAQARTISSCLIEPNRQLKHFGQFDFPQCQIKAGIKRQRFNTTTLLQSSFCMNIDRSCSNKSSRVSSSTVITTCQRRCFCNNVNKDGNTVNNFRISRFMEDMEDKDNVFDSTTSTTPETSHQLYREQLIELQKEREEMFGFTDEEKQAWSSNSSHNMMTTTNDTNPSLQSMEQWLIQQQQEDTIFSVESTSSNLQSISQPTNSTTGTTTTNNGPKTLSHVSVDGKSISMVNVGPKEYTKRTAMAQTKVLFPQEVIDSLFYHNDHKDNLSTYSAENSDNNNKMSTTTNELISPKGPIFATAKIAGIMGCKRTSDLIPLCHPIPIDHIDIDIQLDISTRTVTITCTCTVQNAKTGIEMEALTGCTIAALTIYDMTKAISHNIRITETKLLSKTGGKRTVLDTNTDEVI